MSTKRTPIGRTQRPRISAEAVGLYQRILCLDPNSQEYREACSDLDDCFGRRPWEESVMDVTPYMVEPDGNDGHDTGGAIRIRRGLAALACASTPHTK